MCVWCLLAYHDALSRRTVNEHIDLTPEAFLGLHLHHMLADGLEGSLLVRETNVRLLHGEVQPSLREGAHDIGSTATTKESI